MRIGKDMTGKQIFNDMALGKSPCEIPFVPTVYEHGAKLIGQSPSAVAKNEDLLVRAQLESYRQYGQHLVCVGLDIYNIEFEAIGGKLTYFCEDCKLPEPDGPLIQSRDDFLSLRVPDPFQAGRMPLLLNACRRIAIEIGSEVQVNGTIVGPFTLAAILRGYEDFITDMFSEPEFAQEQLELATLVGLAFGKAYHDMGVGVAINESWIAPPLLSPTWYRDQVFRHEKRLIEGLKASGLSSVALISGGNTTPIAKQMAQTGTSLLMADYGADRAVFLSLCRENNIALRASIESSAVAKGCIEDIYTQTKEVIGSCIRYPKFIFGCGVLSYDTDPNVVRLLRDMVIELNTR